MDVQLRDDEDEQPDLAATQNVCAMQKERLCFSMD